jgi:hypothetical protein
VGRGSITGEGGEHSDWGVGVCVLVFTLKPTGKPTIGPQGFKAIFLNNTLSATKIWNIGKVKKFVLSDSFKLFNG